MPISFGRCEMDGWDNLSDKIKHNIVESEVLGIVTGKQIGRAHV